MGRGDERFFILYKGLMEIFCGKCGVVEMLYIDLFTLVAFDIGWAKWWGSGPIFGAAATSWGYNYSLSPGKWFYGRGTDTVIYKVKIQKPPIETAHYKFFLYPEPRFPNEKCPQTVTIIYIMLT